MGESTCLSKYAKAFLQDWVPENMEEERKGTVPILPKCSSVPRSWHYYGRWHCQARQKSFSWFDKTSYLKVQDFVCIDGFLSHESLIMVSSCNHSKDVQSSSLLRWHKYVFILELPPIRYISRDADMTLVGIEKFYRTVCIELFKFLQLLLFVFVELRRGCFPWAFSYSHIPCAKTDKYRLNVDSLASLPTAFCQASRTLLKLCLSFSIALRTTSCPRLGYPWQVCVLGHFESLSQKCLLDYIYESNGWPKLGSCRPDSNLFGW